MAAIGVLLNRLAPGMPAMLTALRDPQRLADTSGAGALLLAAVGGLAWLAWAWGALGLLLTGLGAMPGLTGWTARQLLRVVLPAGARRAAAVALAVGVALNAPLLAGTALASPAAPSATTDLLLPDWPAAPPTTPPSTT